MEISHIEIPALVKAYFEYATWWVYVGSAKFEEVKASRRTAMDSARAEAQARGASKEEISKAASAAFRSIPHSETHPQEWANDKVTNILSGSDAVAWELLTKLVELAPDDDKVIAFFAAGPLEDFLSLKGNLYFVEIEKLATALPKFKTMLGGVWQGNMDDELWSKLQAIRGKPW